MEDMKTTYTKKAVPALVEKFSYPNVMAVPRLEKVVINTGFGKLIGPKTGDDHKKSIEAIVKDMSELTGQHATITRAKHSIAGFKIREGMPVGAKVTLRGPRMYQFLDRLIHVVLPRSRDFRGLPLSNIDVHGNLSMGIREHIFFSEISPEKVRNMFGIQITVSTTAKSREEGLELFQLLGFPFKK